MADDHDRRIEEQVTAVRLEVAAGFATLRERLDLMKDHEPRIRSLEQSRPTREEITEMVASAVAAAIKPSWQDVGALILAISTATGLVIGVGKIIALVV